MAEIEVTPTEPSEGDAAATPTEAPPPSESSVNPPDAVADAASPPATAPDGGGTIAENIGEEVPVTAPTDWPANWPEIMAGGDPKKLARFKRFGSPVALGNSWLASQQKIGADDIFRAKPEGDDEAALNEWRAQAGIPEKPEGYLEKMPNGLVIGEGDEAKVESFLAKMHAADVSPAHVHEALGWYYELQEQEVTEQAENDKGDRETAETDLIADYGPQYRPNVNTVKNFFNAMAPKGFLDEMAASRMHDGTLMGNNPEFWKFMVGTAFDLGYEGNTVTPNTGETVMQTLQSEYTTLTAEMANTKGPYWNGPESEAKQARWRELSDQIDKQKSRAA